MTGSSPERPVVWALFLLLFAQFPFMWCPCGLRSPGLCDRKLGAEVWAGSSSQRCGEESVHIMTQRSLFRPLKVRKKQCMSVQPGGCWVKGKPGLVDVEAAWAPRTRGILRGK